MATKIYHGSLPSLFARLIFPLVLEEFLTRIVKKGSPFLETSSYRALSFLLS